jgi:maltooligosyltrehalose trehalohydrolase
MSAFGPALRGDGVTFRLWAPAARDVHLVVDRPMRMEKRGEWFEAHLAGARAGMLYRFNIDGEFDIPDPA